MRDSEMVEFSGRPSWLNQMGSFSSMLILILMPFFARDMAPILITVNILAAIFIMLAIINSRYAWEFRIGDGEVQSQQGITSKRQKSIRLKGIKKIEVKQTTIQRVFGVGDVIFNAAGSSSDRVIFFGIESPSEFMDKVLQMQRKKGG
jgi:uncharacterized membrane protein YdbT with pleckstrin-like domain